MILRKLINSICFIILILSLGSCVSKKKYSALQKDLSMREEVYRSEKSQFLTANDSLKYLLVFKDSVIDSLSNKLNVALSKREKTKMPSVAYKKSTLTKEQESE